VIHLYGGLALYLAAAGFAFYAMCRGDRRGLHAARLGAFFGAVDHALFLIRISAKTGNFPITGAIEAYLFLSTAIVLLALILDGLRRWTILVVATLPLAVVTTLLALALTFIPEGQTTPPQSGSSLQTILHIFTALGSYGAFSLAFLSGILYLVAQRQLKDHAAESVLGLMPALETVARINCRSLAAGVTLLAVGLVIGYLQARTDHGIERWWRHDPKIYLTTFTLAAYLTILILSGRPTFKGRRTALASILGFSLVMATFWASVFWSDFHRFH